MNKLNKITFISFMDEQIGLFQDGQRYGTVKNYMCAKTSFLTFRKGQDLLISDVTESIIIDYEIWLKRKNISRNTISFYMRILRSVYNKAVKACIVTQKYPFVKVYTGIDHTSKRAVNENIILKLRKLDLSGYKALSYARDLFIFSFYLRGIAFVDLAFLKKQNLKRGRIEYVRHKTGQPMKICLEPCMKEIIDRYMVKDVSSPYVFPIITFWQDEKKAYSQYKNSLSYYNKQLKRISKILGISQSLTSYVPRHTWATTARNKQIPISIISAGMGHSSEQTTRIYLAAFDTSVIDEANRTIISGLIS